MSLSGRFFLKCSRQFTSDLTQIAEQGVLWLNACLTVRAHKANSHSKQGWEKFTAEVLRAVVNRAMKEGGEERGVVFMVWGLPAQKTCKAIGIDEVSFCQLCSSPELTLHQTKHLVLQYVFMLVSCLAV